MSRLFDDEFRLVIRAVLERSRATATAREPGDRARHRQLGRAGTFAGHRAYAAGEDPRLVDWNAFARAGELFVKVFEAERRRALTLVLDASPSMLAGTPDRFFGARRLGALVGAAALARLDALTLHIGANRFEFEGLSDFERLLAALDAASTTPLCAEEGLSLALKSGVSGRLVWIFDGSDLTEVQRAIRRLGRTANRTLAILAEIEEDHGSAASGFCEFLDPETGARERILVDGRLRDALREELARHARRLDTLFLQSGIPLVRQLVDRARDLTGWLSGGWLPCLR